MKTIYAQNGYLFLNYHKKASYFVQFLNDNTISVGSLSIAKMFTFGLKTNRNIDTHSLATESDYYMKSRTSYKM